MLSRDLRPGTRLRETLNPGAFSLVTGAVEDYAARTGTVRQVTRSLLRRQVKWAGIEWDDEPGMVALHFIGGEGLLPHWLAE